MFKDRVNFLAVNSEEEDDGCVGEGEGKREGGVGE